MSAFKPHGRAAACGLLGLDPGKRYLLFGALGGAGSCRKGGDLLLQGIRRLVARAGTLRDVELLILGESPPRELRDFGLPAHYRGRLHDDLSLALHYSAATLFVAPSREDNLPNTVIEALACDTPVVAFDIGGMPDMIRHKETGWLATPCDVDDLAAGIVWALDNRARMTGLMRGAAEANFAPRSVADAYARIYHRMIEERVRQTI